VDRAYFTVKARLHPALKQQTTDAMHLLEGIRDARHGDLVAASSSYIIDSAGKTKGPMGTHVWICEDQGIYRRSIFDLDGLCIPTASIAMIHAAQDPVLQSIGRSLPSIMGLNPKKDTGIYVDLICLCSGVIALRRLSDMTRSQGDDIFRKRLPHIAAPMVLQDLQEAGREAVSFDLSVFLSQVVSTKPALHSEAGRKTCAPPTTITIEPPD